MNSDDEVICNQSLNKIKKSLHTEGYREGLASGRDLKFQQGFDTGYAEGFKVGFSLGLHNGILRCLKSDLSKIETTIKTQLSITEEVNQASRGLCVVCSQERGDGVNNDSSKSDQETQEVTEIKKLQEKVICERVNQILSEDYTFVLRSYGLDSLLNNMPCD